MGMDEVRACAFWTDREARVALSFLRRSGLSVAAFARREGLSRSRLVYWRSRMEAQSAPLALAPVTVIETRRSGAVAIECLSGRVVRIEGNVDDVLLARVIAAAERAC